MVDSGKIHEYHEWDDNGMGMGISWEYNGNIMGISWEYNGNIMG